MLIYQSEIDLCHSSSRDLLPKEYLKVKNVEKRIFLVSFFNTMNDKNSMVCFFQEHKKYTGLSELDGKVKYTQLCRSLRTYGVTFFLVKVIQNRSKF